MNLASIGCQHLGYRDNFSIPPPRLECLASLMAGMLGLPHGWNASLYPSLNLPPPSSELDRTKQVPAPRGPALHSTARHGIAMHYTAQYCTALQYTKRHITALYSVHCLAVQANTLYTV